MIAPDITAERASAMLAVIKEFQHLHQTDLALVAKRCHWHHYYSGEHIVGYRENTNHTFFIVQGEIRITYYSSSGHEVILCDLPAGEMFGEVTAIDGLARSALVIAKTDSIAASMSAPDFLNLLQSNPNISLAILRRLAGQVRRLTERVFDYSTLSVRNRIHIQLLRLAKRQTVAPNMGVISPAPTHTELANLLSTHREAVTRELNALARAKLIIRKSHDLHILDIAKLKRMVEEARGLHRL
jgi:CRP/FNR family transcriptional regulator, cyclic AMP receptor protein